MKLRHFCLLVMVIFAVLMARQLSAEELRVYTGAWSKHFLNTKEGHLPYQNNHKLAAVEYGNVIAGYFENSYYQDTFFVGAVGKLTWESVDLVASVGVNYGYYHCTKGFTQQTQGDKKVCAYVISGAYYNKYTLQPGVLLTPDFAALSVRWEFDL